MMILDDVMVLSVILVMISHPTSTLPRCIIHVLPAFIAIIFVMSFDEELILPYYCNYE